MRPPQQRTWVEQEAARYAATAPAGLTEQAKARVAVPVTRFYDPLGQVTTTSPAVTSHPRWAAEVARSVCDSAWVDSMTERAVEAGMEPLWNEAQAHWGAEGSQLFETVAECLEALPEAVRTAIREVTEALARAIGAPEWAVVTIGWVASSIPLPYDTALQQGAQAIRLVAVGLSAEQGTLGDCACLPNLVQVRADEFVADNLKRDLRAVAGIAA